MDTRHRSPNPARKSNGRSAAVSDHKQSRRPAASRDASAADLFAAEVRRMCVTDVSRRAVGLVPTMGAASLTASHTYLWGQLIDASEAFKALHKAHRDELSSDGVKRASTRFQFPPEVMREMVKAQAELMGLSTRVVNQLTRINKVWLDYELDTDGKEITIQSDDFQALMEQQAALMQMVMAELGPEKYSDLMGRVQGMMAERGTESATAH